MNIIKINCNAVSTCKNANSNICNNCLRNFNVYHPRDKYEQNNEIENCSLPKVHNLKTWTPFFNDVKNGIKPFEVRKNDRDFQIGDTLILDEYDPETKKYKGGWIPKLITYKLDDERFVKEGFVILGMKDIKF